MKTINKAIFFFLLISAFSCNPQINFKEEVEELYPNGNIKTVIVTDTKNNEIIMRKYYYENGKMEVQMPYSSTYKNGNASFYDSSGKLAFDVFYKMDTLNGERKSYYENGNIKKYSIYNQGVEKSFIFFNEEGEIMQTSSYVTIEAEMDTVKLGDIYSSIIRYNTTPLVDGECSICIREKDENKRKDKNGRVTSLCPMLKVENFHAVYSVRAEHLGENIFTGIALQIKNHPTIKDSIIYGESVDFEGKFFVVK